MNTEGGENFRQWQLYYKNVFSPQNWIDFGFYWTIGAALQRRVWLQSEEKPLFPNMYIVFVGEPSVGKGLVIDPIYELMHYHKLKDKTPDIPIKTKENLENIKALIKMLEETHDREDTKNAVQGKGKLQESLLFPCGPDDITYQSLVNKISLSTRRINTFEGAPFCPNGSYFHCSIAVMIEEMMTLFKRQSESTLKFLLKAYNGGDYEYETISRGQDKIKRNCLSLLAGTTPGQIKEMLDNRIIDDGFASRCICIFEDKRRFQSFGIMPNEGQVEAKYRILSHIKNLSCLFGQVEYSKEAFDYFWNYFVDNSEKLYKNTDPVLKHYYGRKNIHAPKLALAIHFAEVEIIWKDNKPICDMTLQLADAQRAIELLDRVEPTMHQALCFKRKNPLSLVSDKILEYLKTSGPKTKLAIKRALWGDLPNGDESLDKAMEYLLQTEQLDMDDFDFQGKNVKIYKIKEKSK